MKDKILKLLKCKFLFTLPSKDGYLIYDCETLQPNEFVLKKIKFTYLHVRWEKTKTLRYYRAI